MNKEHPITPPPELVQQWALYQGFETPEVLWRQIATQAARWGADQQLEQDAKWLDTNALFSSHLTITPSGDALRQAMRPKLPSLKEEALAVLDDASNRIDAAHENIIRRALESLPD